LSIVPIPSKRSVSLGIGNPRFRIGIIFRQNRDGGRGCFSSGSKVCRRNRSESAVCRKAAFQAVFRFSRGPLTERR